MIEGVIGSLFPVGAEGVAWLAGAECFVINCKIFCSVVNVAVFSGFRTPFYFPSTGMGGGSMEMWGGE
jgi:hypothetical protein